MRADLHKRYIGIKTELKALFDARLVGYEAAANSGEKGWILCHNRGEDLTLYAINAGRYIHTMSQAEIDALTEAVGGVLDKYLTEGGRDEIWSLEYVAAAIRDGTFQASTNLAQQSPLYDAMTTLTDRLNSVGVMNQLAAARRTTFADWTGVSEAAKADLTNVLTDAIVRGVNPRETAKVISARLDVSESKAANIAQTEQVGALRRAQHAEGDWSRDTLGLNVKMLWLSALKPTTRPWHAARHGKLYDTDEIEAFYAVRGNKYFCYCSQIPAVLNPDGSLMNVGLMERLEKERNGWRSESGGRANETGRNAPPASPPKPEPAPRPAPKLEPKPKPASTYTPPTFEPQKSLPALERYATDRLAGTVKLMRGSNLEEANKSLALAAEIQDRFGLEPMRYMGTVRGDTGVRYQRMSKNVQAAYSNGANSMLFSKATFDIEGMTAMGLRSPNYLKSSVHFATTTRNEQLLAVLNELDEVRWETVNTPRGVVAHEYGHRVHYVFWEELNRYAVAADKAGWGHALSRYSQTNHKEYVAEAFALYIEKPAEARRRVYPPLFNAIEKLDKAKK